MLAAVGYGQSTTTCISLDNLTMPPDIHEVCTFADGSGVEIMTISGDSFRTEYPADKWAARYHTALKDDADAGKSMLALLHQQNSEAQATLDHSKKECSAVGGFWADGICGSADWYVENSHYAKQCQQRGGVWVKVEHLSMCRTKDAILSKP